MIYLELEDESACCVKFWLKLHIMNNKSAKGAAEYLTLAEVIR